MTAIKNIGEVMHLVTHTYTVQTFASAVSLLTNYHFRTIGSRQHTHTLPSEKHRFTLFKPLQAHFFFKVAAFLHSLSFFNCRFALPLPLHLDRSVGASFAEFVHCVWNVKLC